jgi:hypothetical protein
MAVSVACMGTRTSSWDQAFSEDSEEPGRFAVTAWAIIVHLPKDHRAFDAFCTGV